MKIKKVNEIVEYTDNELNKIRNRKFPNETNKEYDLWGENLDFMNPEYNKLYTGYSIEDCINYYTSNKKIKIVEYINIIIFYLQKNQ